MTGSESPSDMALTANFSFIAKHFIIILFPSLSGFTYTNAYSPSTSFQFSVPTSSIKKAESENYTEYIDIDIDIDIDISG